MLAGAGTVLLLGRSLLPGGIGPLFFITPIKRFQRVFHHRFFGCSSYFIGLGMGCIIGSQKEKSSDNCPLFSLRCESPLYEIVVMIRTVMFVAINSKRATVSRNPPL